MIDAGAGAGGGLDQVPLAGGRGEMPLTGCVAGSVLAAGMSETTMGSSGAGGADTGGLGIGAGAAEVVTGPGPATTSGVASRESITTGFCDGSDMSAI